MIKPSATIAALLLLFAASVTGVLAGEADVIDVKATKTGERTYRFDVTVLHADEGWDHYADKWEVVAPDGKVLATRVLAHPHETEQPFTRSKSGVVVPEGVNEVSVRAGDSVHGIGGKEIKVKIEP